MTDINDWQDPLLSDGDFPQTLKKSKYIKNNNSESSMFDIRIRDIDPDTGNISQDLRICICENQGMKDLVLQALNQLLKEEADPNRELYFILDSDDISDWDVTLLDGLEDL